MFLESLRSLQQNCPVGTSLCASFSANDWSMGSGVTSVRITLLQTEMRDGAPDHDDRVAVASQIWSVAEPGLHLVDSRLCVSSTSLQDEWVYSFLGTHSEKALCL